MNQDTRVEEHPVLKTIDPVNQKNLYRCAIWLWYSTHGYTRQEIADMLGFGVDNLDKLRSKWEADGTLDEAKTLIYDNNDLRAIVDRSINDTVREFPAVMNNLADIATGRKGSPHSQIEAAKALIQILAQQEQIMLGMFGAKMDERQAIFEGRGITDPVGYLEGVIKSSETI